MFLEINKIEGVYTFEIFNNKVLYISNKPNDQRSVFYDQVCLSSNVSSFVKELKEKIIFGTWDLNVYAYKNNEVKFLLDGYSFNEKKYDDDIIVVAKTNDEGIRFTYLYDINNEKIISKINDIPVISEFNYGIYRFNNTIKKVITQTNTCAWEIDLSGRKYVDPLGKVKDVKIVKLLGIESGQLIVFMNNKELISIDIETGKILWETKEFIKNNLPFYSDHRMTSSIFYYCILENGKLYQLDGNIYYSLDLKTQEVKILWEDKSESEYLTCQYKTYTEDYVYFTGSRNNRFSPYLLGAFNRKTLQMDWIHEPEGLVNPLTNAPTYVDGKLYILDSGGILHIYERE